MTYNDNLRTAYHDSWHPVTFFPKNLRTVILRIICSVDTTSIFFQIINRTEQPDMVNEIGFRKIPPLSY